MQCVYTASPLYYTLALGHFILFVLHYIVAAVVAILTAYKLYKTLGPATNRRNYMKGSITILIMNVINFIFPIFAVVSFYVANTGSSNLFNNLRAFLSYYFLTVVISAVNPTIVIVCSSGIKNMLKSWIRELKTV